MRKIWIFLIAFLIIFFLIGFVLVASGYVGFGIGGNKVTVHGTAYYALIVGWGVTYSSVNTQPEFISIYLPGYWFMETKDVLIYIELTNINGGVYSNYKWIGTMSSIIGSKDFSIDVHNVPSGSCQGTIYVYEIERKEISLFPFSPTFRWGELNRYLRATCGGWTIEIR